MAQLEQDVITVPQWGPVVVRELTAVEAQHIEREANEDGIEAMFRYVRYGVVNSRGEQLFLDEDLPSIRILSMKIIKPIAMCIRDLSGLNPDSVEVSAKKS